MAFSVTVKLYANLKEFSENMSELIVMMEHENSSVRSIINVLPERLREKLIDPKSGELARGYIVAVNGKLASLDNTLKENDVVTFIPAIDGG